ncbi:MAG: SUMF1/EgtB/PvdO family nonheme iron enzyme, partial [Planctomycetota bacterium]
MDASAPPHHAGCPRCGARIPEAYKYCPNCAYRLRPELFDLPKARPQGSRFGPRLLALASFLAFGSLFLLVVLAGFHLFADPDVSVGTARPSGIARDHNAVPLDRESFVWVEPGRVIWGLFSPDGDPTEGPKSQEQVDDRFQLLAHEVTNDQFYEFLRARAERSGQPVPRAMYPKSWTRSPPGGAAVARIYDRGKGNDPVTHVGFHTALEFCAWVWASVFDSSPDVVVDLPTAYEYTVAARGDSVIDNFPWGSQLEPDRANLDGKIVAVNDPGYAPYGGFFHLVGNVAEWVHGYDPQRTPTAAGWSFLDGHNYRYWEDPAVQDTTPFEDAEFERRRAGPPDAQVGFRVVARPTPSRPSFLLVERGEVHHILSAAGDGSRERILPPVRDKQQTREPPVAFEQGRVAVSADFEIARHEITNRQYLFFLTENESRLSRARLRALIPGSFRRPHPFSGGDFAYDAEFPGPFGDPRKVFLTYEAGHDNHPVEGIRVPQAEAFAAWLSRPGRPCRIPTAAEFLRAGRGAATAPYPPGYGIYDTRLICAGRGDELGRAVSLLSEEGDQPLGLAGNLTELVWDPNRK